MMAHSSPASLSPRAPILCTITTRCSDELRSSLCAASAARRQYLRTDARSNRIHLPERLREHTAHVASSRTAHPLVLGLASEWAKSLGRFLFLNRFRPPSALAHFSNSCGLRSLASPQAHSLNFSPSTGQTVTLTCEQLD